MRDKKFCSWLSKVKPRIQNNGMRLKYKFMVGAVILSAVPVLIASAAEEQSAVAEEINRNVIHITEMAEQAASASWQTSEAGGELSGLPSDLRIVVGRCKI